MKEIKPWERGNNKKNNISIDDFYKITKEKQNKTQPKE